jgi:hypothetical protein
MVSAFGIAMSLNDPQWGRGSGSGNDGKGGKD